MTIRNVTERRAVLQAIRECDELGRDEFLSTYGYKRSRIYELVYSRRRYDSKAIIAVAHKYQHGEPLWYGDFNGGKDATARILRGMGFRVLGPGDADDSGEDVSPIAKKRTTGGAAAWQQDPEKRVATEARGVEVAFALMAADGYSVEIFGKPFDLLCTRGNDVVKVEVKASVGEAESVRLTINEVNTATRAGRDYRSLLVVVDQVTLKELGGTWHGVGGRVRLWWDWTPEPARLTPTEFIYNLPS